DLVRRQRLRAQQGPVQPMLYQVDLHGPHVALHNAHLSDLVETNCSRCSTPLLAEGEGFRHGLQVAEDAACLLTPVCAACCKHLMYEKGELLRTLPANPEHDKEFKESLGRLTEERAHAGLN